MLYFCLGRANYGSAKHRSQRSVVKFMVIISHVLQHCLEILSSFVGTDVSFAIL